MAAGLLLLVAGALGCTNIGEKELNYRKAYKRIWDRTMTQTDRARKSVDKSYEAGDIATAVATYKKIGQEYAQARVDLNKIKSLPGGYTNLKKISLEYFAEGTRYYTTVAAIIESSGGNYDQTQQGQIKVQESRWNTITKKLKKELKAKRFEIK